MFVRALGLAVAGLCLCAAALQAGGDAKDAVPANVAQGASDNAEEIKTLLKERREALSEAVVLLSQSYKEGKVEFMSAAWAHLDRHGDAPALIAG